MSKAVTYVNGPGDAKFFEEFVESYNGVTRPKGLGVRLVMDNAENRALGVAGARKIILVEDTILLRCFKEVVVKASAKRPIRVVTYLYPLGR
jgi:hypothetical protein